MCVCVEREREREREKEREREREERERERERESCITTTKAVRVVKRGTVRRRTKQKDLKSAPTDKNFNGQ